MKQRDSKKAFQGIGKVIFSQFSRGVWLLLWIGLYWCLLLSRDFHLFSFEPFISQHFYKVTHCPGLDLPKILLFSTKSSGSHLIAKTFWHFLANGNFSVYFPFLRYMGRCCLWAPMQKCIQGQTTNICTSQLLFYVNIEILCRFKQIPAFPPTCQPFGLGSVTLHPQRFLPKAVTYKVDPSDDKEQGIRKQICPNSVVLELSLLPGCIN